MRYNLPQLNSPSKARGTGPMTVRQPGFAAKGVPMHQLTMSGTDEDSR